MIDKQTARQLAYEFINADYKVKDDECAIMDEYTREKDYGYIFFYQSPKFIETRDYGHALTGNGPIIVEKSDGSIRTLPTGRPLEELIAEYETWKQQGRPSHWWFS